MHRYDHRSVFLAISLAAVAGYVDSVGFMSLGKVFVSFMSGNTTRLGIAMVHGDFWMMANLFGGIVLFVIGVSLGTYVARQSAHQRKSKVLGLVTGLLLVAAVFATAHLSHPAVACLLVAMGAENAVFQRRGEVTVGLTYVTGALVRLGQNITAALLGQSKAAWGPYALLWLGLLSGSALGTAVHTCWSTLSLWPAVLAMAALWRFGQKLPVRYL